MKFEKRPGLARVLLRTHLSPTSRARRRFRFGKVELGCPYMERLEFGNHNIQSLEIRSYISQIEPIELFWLDKKVDLNSPSPGQSHLLRRRPRL